MEDTNATELGIALIYESIYLVGVAVAMGFTCNYFKHELADGTPFTHSGADLIVCAGTPPVNNSNEIN